VRQIPRHFSLLPFDYCLKFAALFSDSVFPNRGVWFRN